MTRYVWRLFWHGYRNGYGARCARCADYEYSARHPRGMRGRKVGRWYI